MEPHIYPVEEKNLVFKNQPVDKLLDQVKNFGSKNIENSKVASAFVEFVSSRPNCISDCHDFSNEESGHVTASCWLLNPSRDKVLLTHHKKLKRWLQLGGHCSLGETVKQAALREAYEESGIESIQFLSEDIFDLDIHSIPEKKQILHHWHYDVRYQMIAASENFQVSDESLNLKWFLIEEIAENNTFDASLVRMAYRTLQ